MASLSVKSTRYTLKELKSEPTFYFWQSRTCLKYIVYWCKEVDEASISASERARPLVVSGLSMTKVKFLGLPWGFPKLELFLGHPNGWKSFQTF